jgi:hypothetical protein
MLFINIPNYYTTKQCYTKNKRSCHPRNDWQEESASFMLSGLVQNDD